MVTPLGDRARVNRTILQRRLPFVALCNSVRYLPRQARVGLVGPDSSNAQVAYGPGSGTFPWDDGHDLHLAVVLTDGNDAVQIVPPPLPMCPTIASLSPSGDSSWWGTDVRGSGWAGKSDGWFGSVKESLELLSAALSREIPECFIARKLLPEVGVGTNLTFSFRAAMRLVEVHVLRQLFLAAFVCHRTLRVECCKRC